MTDIRDIVKKAEKEAEKEIRALSESVTDKNRRRKEKWNT